MSDAQADKMCPPDEVCKTPAYIFLSSITPSW